MENLPQATIYPNNRANCLLITFGIIARSIVVPFTIGILTYSLENLSVPLAITTQSPGSMCFNFFI